MEKFTWLEQIKYYKYVVLGVILLVVAALVWSEEEPGFSIVFGFFGFILIMKSLS